MQDQPFSNGTLGPELARGVCRKILSGPTFRGAPRLSRLLESCVEAHAGGTQPALDADGRGELKRLRRKLEDYYEAEGAGDPARVELTMPEGSVRFDVTAQPIDVAAWVATAVPAAARAESRRWAIAAVLAVVAAGGAFWLYNRQAMADPGDVRTIAVLPIDDGRPIQLHDKFVPGITAAITAELAHVPRWKTIEYASAQPYSYNLRELASLRRELGADIVVEGRLTPGETKVEGELWMRRTSDGRQVWRSAFSAPRDELLAGIDKAAQGIAERLGAGLPGQALLSVKSGKANREAVEEYLNARAVYQETPQELQTALRALEAATAAAPQFAAAQGALAGVWARITQREYRPAAEAVAKTREIAAAALALEPNSAEAHLALGVAAMFDKWDWAVARKELDRALELRPSYPYALARLAQIDQAEGDSKAAVGRLERAHELNPSHQALDIELGFAYVFNGQHEKALELMSKVERLDPEFKAIRLVRAMAYVGKKEFGRVGSHLETMVRQRAWMPSSFAIAAPAAAFAGDKSVAERALSEMRKKENLAKPDPVVLAGILLAVGQDKEAFELLNQAVTARNTLLLTLGVNPIFERYRGDARFREIVRKVRAGG